MAAASTIASVTIGRNTLQPVFASADPGNSDMVAGTTTGVDLEYTIYAIQFALNAATDRIIIRDESITGAVIFDSGPATAENTSAVSISFPYGKKCSPCIDISECTLTTEASARLMIHYR